MAGMEYHVVLAQWAAYLMNQEHCRGRHVNQHKTPSLCFTTSTRVALKCTRGHGLIYGGRLSVGDETSTTDPAGYIVTSVATVNFLGPLLLSLTKPGSSLGNGWIITFTWLCMMTSSNGNIFRVTGHLCGEFIGPRWIPHTKASDAELWCLLWSASE